jgi:hypothetical protein
VGFVCDPNQLVCVAPSGGDGGQSYEAGGDCSTNGCPSGEVCLLSNGVAQCVLMGDDGDDASTSEGGADAGDGGSSDGSMTKTDASGDASEGGTVSGPCNSDGVCGGNGAKCIDGTCTSQVHLCSDGSQCSVPAFSCVNGVCEPQCSSTSPCPTGYACDLTRGVCNVNPDPCTGSGASTCQGGTTCADGYCVPPCGTGDAAPACSTGQVCVNGGCIPDQGASFACSNDGESGSLATTCPTDDVCLHHDCYEQCAADAGSCSASSVPQQVCKNVTIETGTYSVCGTATTLGSQCDPSQGNYCMGNKVCVDGYCL